MIAGFWADVNLQCTGTANVVEFSQSCSSALLSQIRSQVNDPSFNPTSAVVVKYNAVQRYTCPIDCDVSAKIRMHHYMYRFVCNVFFRLTPSQSLLLLIREPAAVTSSLIMLAWDGTELPHFTTHQLLVIPMADAKVSRLPLDLMLQLT